MTELRHFLIWRDSNGPRRIDVFEPDQKKEAMSAYKKTKGACLVSSDSFVTLMACEAHRLLLEPVTASGSE